MCADMRLNISLFAKKSCSSLRSEHDLAPIAGFEPAGDCSPPVFETGTFDHSDILASIIAWPRRAATRTGASRFIFNLRAPPARKSGCRLSNLAWLTSGRPGPTLLVQMPIVWRCATAWSCVAQFDVSIASKLAWDKFMFDSIRLFLANRPCVCHIATYCRRLVMSIGRHILKIWPHGVYTPCG